MSIMPWAAVTALCACLLGCEGDSARIVDPDGDADVDSDADCAPPAGDAPPGPPAIVDPAEGSIDVQGDSLVIRTGGFTDPDGDGHRATEAEIWLAPGGVRAERVWRATNETRLLEFVLGDGAFEGSAAAQGALAGGADHIARVRYQDDVGACGAWSDWSPERLFRTDDGSSFFFGTGEIPTFELELPPETVDSLNAEAYPPGGCTQYLRNYYTGTLIFEGVRYEGVGVRLKGGCGSSRNLDGKSSFKISLDWDDPDVPGCPEPRRIHGLSRFTLNNGVQDWTQEHEALGYALYREMGVPAPRVGHGKVYVNGEYYGLYVHIETTDRRFLRRWFENADGMMYEGAYWCDLYPDNVPDELDEWACFAREFSTGVCDDADEGREPTDWELLRQLTVEIDELPFDGFYAGIQDIFDFDEFLSMWAVEGVLAHWDAYSFNIINNYRVYHDPVSDRWTMIPWGIDQTFGGDLDPWDSDALLVNRCLADQDCEDAFAARLEEAIQTYESLSLGPEAQRLYDRIAPDLRADPRKEYDNNQYTWAYQGLVDWIPWRADRVRQILSDHGY